jgi:hypothetical protein
MLDLLGYEVERPMTLSAVISECEDYRPELRRIWDESLPLLVVCMLNPSRADASINDPTVLTLIHFAKLWGYGGLLIVNLYDFRASKPTEMFAAEAPVSKDNYRYIEQAIQYASDNGRKLLAAWGNGPDEMERRNPAMLSQADWFASRCQGRVELVCLGKTNSGAPKHPMARGLHRIPRDQQPITWRASAPPRQSINAEDGI